MQLYYPIGSLYFNVNLINSSTVLGGTWVRIKERFILAAGSSYPGGQTGGSATVTLSLSQIPSHSHSCSTNGEHDHDLRMSNESGSGLNWPQKRNCNGYATYVNQIGSNGSHSHTIGSAGGGSSHNNMPPYLSVYVWKRAS